MKQDHIWEQFISLSGKPDNEIPLDHVAFLIAASEKPGLDIEHQMDVLDSLAAGIATRFGEEPSPLFCVNLLSEYLFDELEFRGDEETYSDPRNSLLDEVLTRKLGIPISLSLLYIEIGRRLGIPLIGIGMPGHFLVRHVNEQNLFIDPYYGGTLLSVQECMKRVERITGTTHWQKRYLDPVGNREFIARILRNLKNSYLQRDAYVSALNTIDWLIGLQPGIPQEIRDRGFLNYRLGNYQKALIDLNEYLATVQTGPDIAAVQDLINHISGMYLN